MKNLFRLLWLVAAAAVFLLIMVGMYWIILVLPLVGFIGLAVVQAFTNPNKDKRRGME